MSNVGFRIYTKINRPPKELVEGFRGLPASTIADNMNRFGCMHSDIKPMNSVPLLGTAFTVKLRTADSLLFHKALEMAQPGDVIVVDVHGDKVNAVAGEIMMRLALKRGIAGFVIDGVIRDSAALQNLEFPVYARGASPQGPYKDGPGEINVPVTCGGVVVNPGDILVGDADGVVVISPKDAPEVLAKAQATLAKEEETFKALAEGTLDRSWIDKLLAEKGCEII